MHENESGEAARGVHHHHDEERPDIDLPGIGNEAYPALQQCYGHGAGDRPPEHPGAANQGHEKSVARHDSAERVVSDDFVHYGIERPSDSCKAAREGELAETHPAWIIANELRSLIIISARVGHAAERGLRE